MTSLSAPLVLLLIGLPLLYQANSSMPWTRGLFVDRDRSYRASFLTSIQSLHIGTTIAALAWLWASGHELRAVGVSPLQMLVSQALFGMIGLILAHLDPKRQTAPHGRGDAVALPSLIDLIAPVSRAERKSFVLVCLIAGTCEELLYRGIAITLLTNAGFHIVSAIVLSSLAFAAIHGRAAFSAAGLYWFVKGTIYGIIFTLSGNLVVVIALHTAWDLALLLRAPEHSWRSRHPGPSTTK